MSKALIFGEGSPSTGEELDRRRQQFEANHRRLLAQFDIELPATGEVVNPDHFQPFRLPDAEMVELLQLGEADLKVMSSFVSTLDRRRNQCAYPAVVQDGVQFFCGQPVHPVSDCSWCYAHLLRVFNAQPKKYGGKGSMSPEKYRSTSSPR